MTDEATDVRDCRYPWNGFMPMSEGQVLCCCYGSNPVGMLAESSPEEIWNGPSYRSLRASLSAGVIHSVCQTAACKFVMGSRARGEAPAAAPPSLEGFDERWYCATYFDVRSGIETKRWRTGRAHFLKYGHREFRFRNEAEWKVWADADRAVALPIEKAKLTWEGEPRREGERIVLRFRALNEGSGNWDPGLVRACAWIMPRLMRPDFGNEHAQRGLSSQVRPGESVELSLELPVGALPANRSFVLVDLISTRRFSDSMTRPLILAVSVGASGEPQLWATSVSEPRRLSVTEEEVSVP